jgi:hypothetical protein
LPINAPEYTKVVKEIAAVEEALKLKDLVPGDWVKLHQQGSEQGERQFVGMVKLEWTQHRQLFDRQADCSGGLRWSNYYTFNEVNFRDDGESVIRDSQWVGLFTSKVKTTRTKVGTHHGGQPVYEYSEPEPSVSLENNTVKITSRRAGELPEAYEDLDKVLATLSYNNYEDRPQGRYDCPQRVQSKFEKQEITHWQSCRVAGKDLTRATFTAKVVQKA